MEITRRSFLAGLGSVTVGLLFARKLDAVLESLERDLVAEQQVPDQPPSAAEIVVVPSMNFCIERLAIPMDIAALFVIEDIRIGTASQFSGGGISADVFSLNASDIRLDDAPAGTAIRFRVRYVGTDPRGARFTAALLGTAVDREGRRVPAIDGGGRRVLPIDSGCMIVG